MFTTAYNFDFDKSPKETFKMPSLTLPDMSFTVQDMLDRFVRGVPPPNSNLPYDDDDGVVDESFFIDPTRSQDFDIADIPLMYAELQSIQDNLKREEERLRAEKAAAADAAKQGQA